MPTVASLAALVGGSALGDATREIDGVADLVSAGPRDLSFFTNPKYRDQLVSTSAGAVLVSTPLPVERTSLIVCANPYLALARIATALYPPPPRTAGVEPGAFVHSQATVHESATVRVGAIVDAGALVGARSLIGPGCYVGDGARVGADVTLHSGAKVLARCVLGDRVILHAGVVIGSDGFGYAPDATGKRHKIPQIGIVEVGDDVEIGANTTVDRATFGATRIGAGTKIDNLVQIAHNVVLGQDCVIVSQSGIAGSTELGDRVVMGAQGGVVGHIEIASDVMLGARAGVAATIDKPGVYSGAPVQPHREWLRMVTAEQTLPELRRRVRELERRIEALRDGLRPPQGTALGGAAVGRSPTE